MSKHCIYFDEGKHKYFDDFNNPFTSVTTIISKYEEKFDTNHMAYVCYKSGLKGNSKYAGKSIAQIKAEWKDRNTNSLAFGTKDHDYLEQAIKQSGNYYKVSRKLKNKQIYTIEDVLEDTSLGVLDLISPEMLEVKAKFPMIYLTFEILTNKGFRILSEVGVFNLKWLVSGLIDIIAIKDNEFKIVDWKTNNDPIMFEAGYWKHDENYNIDGYIKNYKKLLYPLDTIDHATGMVYTIQLSTYATLVEQYGLTCTGILLYHIRKHNYQDGHPHLRYDFINKDLRQLDSHKLQFLKDDVTKMLNHHVKGQNTDIGHKLIFG